MTSGVRRRGDQVLARTRLGDRDREVLAERDHVDTRRRREAELVGFARGAQLVGRAVGEQAPVVDDEHPVGQTLGLVEVVRGEQHRHAVVA